jgi:hypothetical protein
MASIGSREVPDDAMPLNVIASAAVRHLNKQDWIASSQGLLAMTAFPVEPRNLKKNREACRVPVRCFVLG